MARCNDLTRRLENIDLLQKLNCMECAMKLSSVFVAAAAGLLLSTAASAEVIAAKKIRLDPLHKALIMLSDERFQCDGDPDGRFATLIVAMDGAMNPSRTYKACYTVADGELDIIFWDPATNDPKDAGTLQMSEASFERTPQFKSWNFIRTAATPAR